jgi:hypothetical protein
VPAGGEWNDRARWSTTAVQHWLNGVKVVEYEIGRRIGPRGRVQFGGRSSPAAELPRWGTGNPVWFRDPKIGVLK